MVKGDRPSMSYMRDGRLMFPSLPVHDRFIIILRSWDVIGTSASSKKGFAIMYFSTIIIMYGSVSPLAEHCCKYSGRSTSSPVMALPHICSKVRISPLDICFDSSFLSFVLVLALVFDEVFFAEVVFPSKMALISATKSGPCGVSPPAATGPPGVARVGNHRKMFP